MSESIPDDELDPPGQAPSALSPPDSLSIARLKLAHGDAVARREFLDRIPTLDLKRAQLGSAHTAWRQLGKIFSANQGSIEYYPAFQFDANGQPRSVIGQLLTILRADQRRTDWQNAFWFVSGNGWLGGGAPMDRLPGGLEDIQAVITAANHAVAPEVC